MVPGIAIRGSSAVAATTGASAAPAAARIKAPILYVAMRRDSGPAQSLASVANGEHAYVRQMVFSIEVWIPSCCCAEFFPIEGYCQ